jgi:hypothetical protein
MRQMTSVGGVQPRPPIERPVHRDQDGFELPESVAECLRASGYVRASSSEIPAAGATVLALTVRHHGRSSVVFLVHAPGVVRALAKALVAWFNECATHQRLELVARRASGAGSYRADSAPSVDGVASFLRDGIWGDNAPPDTPAGDSSPCLRVVR